MQHRIDYTALITAVTKTQVAEFKAQSIAAGRNWGRGTAAQILMMIGVFVVIGFVLLGFGASGLVAIVSAIRSSANAGAFIALAFPGAFVAAFTVFLLYGLVHLLRNDNWAKWMKLSHFADANGLVFSPSDPSPNYPGLIFNSGHSQVALDHLRSTTDRYLDMGNYRYVTGSGKNATTHNWGFLAFKLDRKLPNMVLDSKANNGLFGGTNLPAIFARNQILPLEGDFDKYFTLYCPKEYEQDALYIFTPDLMALLIDEAAPFDVEIVDDWMFVYSARPFVSGDPAVYQRLFQIVDTVGAKAATQSERYTDDRVGSFAANIVAPQGQRLKRGASVGLVIFVFVFAIIWSLPWTSSLFGG